MKTIGIIPNTYKDSDFSATKEIAEWLIKKGHNPITAENIGIEKLNKTIEEVYGNSDFLLVLGGDGTILKVAKNSAITNTPIYGINFGTLGYLTDVEKHDAFIGLEKLLSGDFTIEKRMMLEAKVLNTDSADDKLIALNDICIVRGFFGTIITLELYINKKYINTYRSDGLIISTPTGSTAYNLSAGGPILKPDSKMIAITPICPHTLHNRPFVISADDEVSIKVINKRSTDIVLSLDGQNPLHMKDDDVIEISASKFYTSIVRTTDLGFYDILRKKFIYTETELE